MKRDNDKHHRLAKKISLTIGIFLGLMMVVALIIFYWSGWKEEDEREHDQVEEKISLMLGLVEVMVFIVVGVLWIDLNEERNTAMKITQLEIKQHLRFVLVEVVTIVAVAALYAVATTVIVDRSKWKEKDANERDHVEEKIRFTIAVVLRVVRAVVAVVVDNCSKSRKKDHDGHLPRKDRKLLLSIGLVVEMMLIILVHSVSSLLICGWSNSMKSETTMNIISWNVRRHLHSDLSRRLSYSFSSSSSLFLWLLIDPNKQWEMMMNISRMKTRYQLRFGRVLDVDLHCRRRCSWSIQMKKKRWRRSSPTEQNVSLTSGLVMIVISEKSEWFQDQLLCLKRRVSTGLKKMIWQQ